MAKKVNKPVVTDEGSGKGALKLEPATTASYDTVTQNAAMELHMRHYSALLLDGDDEPFDDDMATLLALTFDADLNAQAQNICGIYLKQQLQGLSEAWASRVFKHNNTAAEQAAIDAARLKDS